MKESTQMDSVVSRASRIFPPPIVLIALFTCVASEVYASVSCFSFDQAVGRSLFSVGPSLGIVIYIWFVEWLIVFSSICSFVYFLFTRLWLGLAVQIYNVAKAADRVRRVFLFLFSFFCLLHSSLHLFLQSMPASVSSQQSTRAEIAPQVFRNLLKGGVLFLCGLVFTPMVMLENVHQLFSAGLFARFVLTVPWFLSLFVCMESLSLFFIVAFVFFLS